MNCEEVADVVERLAHRGNGDGLQLRIWGFLDGLRGSEPRRPERVPSMTKRKHTAAVRRYLDGHKEGLETRKRDLRLAAHPAAYPQGGYR